MTASTAAFAAETDPSRLTNHRSEPRRMLPFGSHGKGRSTDKAG
jgi:hypothetical protein